MTLTMGTIAIVVRNEKKAVNFYTKKLGFKLVDDWPHWRTVSAKGSKQEIHLCPDSPPEKGNTGISFYTSDIQKEHKRLVKAGVKITQPITKEEWGTYFMFADPDGNEFYAFEG